MNFRSIFSLFDRGLDHRILPDSVGAVAVPCRGSLLRLRLLRRCLAMAAGLFRRSASCSRSRSDRRSRDFGGGHVENSFAEGVHSALPVDHDEVAAVALREHQTFMFKSGLESCAPQSERSQQSRMVFRTSWMSMPRRRACSSSARVGAYLIGPSRWFVTGLKPEMQFQFAADFFEPVLEKRQWFRRQCVLVDPAPGDMHVLIAVSRWCGTQWRGAGR